jgi:hypothetical protein
MLRGSVLLGCLTVLLSLTACSSESATIVEQEDGVVADTPAAAVQRLWPEELALLKDATDAGSAKAEALDGAEAGPPIPASAKYFMTMPLLARWVLSDDRQAVRGDMFSAMRPTPASTSTFMVGAFNDGRAVAEFTIVRGKDRRWRLGVSSAGPGLIADRDAARAQLKAVLGESAAVRTAVFLPSGLEFAVGQNAGRQAAVYLTFVSHGEGVDGSFLTKFPATGRLFTPAQLVKFLTP